MCVVLPGIGLGWVTNDQVLSTEHESIDRMSHESTVSIKWISKRLCELTNGVQFMPEQLQVFGSLLDYTGRYVTSVTFDGSTDIDAILPVVMRHCGNLRHLSLCGHLSDAGMDVLVKRLVDGNLGDKLLLLLLRLEQSRFGSVSVEKIAGILANLERTPALLDLRLGVPYLSPQVYASLRRALVVNKTLQFSTCRCQVGMRGTMANCCHVTSTSRLRNSTRVSCSRPCCR